VSTQLQTTWRWASLDEGNDRWRVLANAVRGEAVRLLADEYAGRLRAIILTGSLARDEATVVEKEGRWKCLGDAEFLLVFEERNRMPATSELEPLLRQIEARLEQRNIFCHVVAGACRADGLSKFRPSIFVHELRTQGEVVWGDVKILSLLPGFSASDIPREDAWQMLCNRMIEQLEVMAESKPDTEAIVHVQYRAVKLYLDMATSLLVFFGAYQPTYRERAEHLRLVAEKGSAQDFPFSLQVFANRVAACTQFKLQESVAWDADAPEIVADFGFLNEALLYAKHLWRWELARLADSSDQLPECQLLERWMRLQPMRKRLRGWLYLLRARGRHWGWRNWQRWLRLARRASPRYCVYAAASRLFSGLPATQDSSAAPLNAKVDWDEARSWLPVFTGPRTNGESETWQRLATEIAWNYHQFLEGTQA